MDPDTKEFLERAGGDARHVPCCKACGCPVTTHAVDDEERRECGRCNCRQFETLRDVHRQVQDSIAEGEALRKELGLDTETK